MHISNTDMYFATSVDNGEASKSGPGAAIGQTWD